MGILIRATVILFALTALVQAQDPGGLRWRLQKDKPLKYKFTHREVRTVELGDQKFETTTTNEWEWRCTLRGADADGIATIDLKPTSLRVTSQGKEFEFSYDSGKGERGSDDYKKRLSNLYDQILFTGKYTLRLRPTGEVVDVRGLSKIVEDTNPGADIIDFHGLNLRDDVLAWFLQQALGRLPDRDQAKQGKWRVAVETNLDNLGPVTGELLFMMKPPVKVGERVLQEIGVSGTQSIDLDMKWLGNVVKGTLKTTKYAGTLRFDAAAGRVEQASVQMLLGGALKFGNAKTSNMKITYKHDLDVEAQR